MNEEDKMHLNALKEYVKEADERRVYSIKRFDILIISLSTGGLILVLNLFNQSFFSNNDKCYLSLSFSFFAVTLVKNLLSQVTGYFANSFDIKETKNEIAQLSGKPTSKGWFSFEKLNQIFSYSTKALYTISFLTFILSIILLIIFVN